MHDASIACLIEPARFSACSYRRIYLLFRFFGKFRPAEVRSIASGIVFPRGFADGPKLSRAQDTLVACVSRPLLLIATASTCHGNMYVRPRPEAQKEKTVWVLLILLLLLGCLRFATLCWVENMKRINVIMKPTKSSTQGQANTRKMRLKVASGPLFPTNK